MDPKLGSAPQLTGRRVTAVNRQGKSIIIKLDDDRCIRLHLRMTGRLLWQDGGIKYMVPDYSRWRIVFSHGCLDCIDPRRFATFQIGQIGKESSVSPDPLEEFDTDRLIKIAASRKICIKCLLLDQAVISGIGNIYACEILHLAKIDPARKASDLTRSQWKRIADALRPILQTAIDCRGTTASDWRDLFGNPGEYQKYLKVYTKEGLPCSVCQGTVRRIRLGGRGTYYCPSCQR